jgi:cobalt-zinc-cadmium resistance protein CzcA
MGILERLIESSLRQRVLVIVGVLFLIGFGTWALLHIPIDAFPDVTNIQIEVLSTAPGRRWSDL